MSAFQGQPIFTDAASPPGPITPPARWSHKRRYWATGRFGGYDRIMFPCARQILPPNNLRGVYHEAQEAVQVTESHNVEAAVEVGQYHVRFGGESVKERTSTITVRRYACAHIVVGLISKKMGDVYEGLEDSISEEDLFVRIRKAKRALRPWWKSVLSLKSVQGFSLYQCHPENEYHEPIELDESTKALLSELWNEYSHEKKDEGGRWLAWVQQHLNRGDIPTTIGEPSEADTGPSSGKAHEPTANVPAPSPRCLSLQLVVKWSAAKIAIYGLTPILVSLAVGFWFQYSQEGDRIAVVQTAWTISSYIIGASGVALAVIAAITQLGDT